MKPLALLAVLLVSLGIGPAWAASGTALGVDPDARLEDKAGAKTLVVGTDVFIGDRVITDAAGLVQIRFGDRTELTVGPSSSLVIEDYLLREDGSAGKFAINALSGTFRFVTGRSPKDSYDIKTPTGIIGVRGTAFDLNVKSDHSSAMIYHGAIVMCNTAGQCVTVSETCDVGMFDQAGASIVGNGNDFEGAERASMRNMFPYAVDESPLRGDFRVDGARECLNRALREVNEREPNDPPPPPPPQEG
ncbi:MAG: FecR family protein [Devosia sp.]